ncbi:MAG TPA: RNA-guided endonuclease TnpB family protein [Planctomycetota bacterium]|nr:RNA-guided endonuclease TnpB family protein [Planctomycetota bacterium]
MKVRYRFRFYPTPAQRQTLARVFGSCRYVYNWALRLRSDAWSQEGRSVTDGETSALLPRLKREPDHAWLREISSVPTQQALRHLETAFVNFFEKRALYPSFKKKSSDQSAEYTRSAFTWDSRNHRLSLSGLGRLRVRWSREVKSSPSTVAVQRDSAGRYFASLCLNEEPEKLKPVHRVVGIDLGITALATLSSGEKIENPRPLDRMERRLVRAQRALARKKKGSNRRATQRLRVARLHARISDRRRDHLNKTTTDLVKRFDVIALEDLNVRGMVQNHALARAISDAGLGEFRRMVEYKCGWYGRELRLADRFHPSSRRCSGCGHVLEELPLGTREWDCPECGEHHDREVNAAKNILAAGQAVTARGGKVRP